LEQVLASAFWMQLPQASPYEANVPFAQNSLAQTELHGPPLPQAHFCTRPRKIFPLAGSTWLQHPQMHCWCCAPEDPSCCQQHETPAPDPLPEQSKPPELLLETPLDDAPEPLADEPPELLPLAPLEEPLPEPLAEPLLAAAPLPEPEDPPLSPPSGWVEMVPPQAARTSTTMHPAAVRVIG
jgi:hypothetical protein